MQCDVALIGGTGVGSRLAELGGVPVHIPTPYGTVRGRIADGLLLLSRHSAGHKVPPHRVNYAAIALAARASGARAVFATAAVGSLVPEWGPGTFVVCSDLLDATDRQITIHDLSVVHTDMTTPFPARQHLLGAARALGIEVQDGGVYLAANGPRYETPQEIRMYRGWGAEVVGMTASTEAIVMREAGVPYACLAIVTNLASGIADGPLSHGEVADEMERSGERAVALLLEAARRV